MDGCIVHTLLVAMGEQFIKKILKPEVKVTELIDTKVLSHDKNVRKMFDIFIRDRSESSSTRGIHSVNFASMKIRLKNLVNHFKISDLP